MKIIIVGCGKVGYAIAQQLTQEKHDITLVDDEAVHLSRADNTLDAMCIHGNGASISVLMEAPLPWMHSTSSVLSARFRWAASSSTTVMSCFSWVSCWAMA